MVFLFQTPSWVRPWCVFCAGHFAGSARLSYHHRHRHQEAASHNFTGETFGWTSKYLTRCWFQIKKISPPWGRFPIWLNIFSDGLVQPPTSYITSSLVKPDLSITWDKKLLVVTQLVLKLLQKKTACSNQFSPSRCFGEGGWQSKMFFEKPSCLIRLMDEILHHLGCIKPCKWWDNLLINWCRISASSISDVLIYLATLRGLLSGSKNPILQFRSHH